MAGASFSNGSGLGALSNTNDTVETNVAFEGYRLGMCVVIVALNVILMVLLLHEKFAQSAFMIYLKFLTGGSIILVVVIQPIMSLWWVFHEDDAQYRSAGCAVVWYWDEVVGGTVLGFHALITVNRLWAFVLPVSYRNKHSAEVAVISCVLVFVYANVWFLPSFCLAFVRLPADAHCSALPQYFPEWYVVKTVMTKTVPTILVILGYFVISARIYFRHAAVRHENLKVAVPMSSSVKHEAEPSREVHPAHHHHELTLRSGSFAILTASSISVAVTWIPYTIDLCLTEDSRAAASVFARVLVQFQPLLDPLLLFILMKDLRAALYYRVRFWRKR